MTLGPSSHTTLDAIIRKARYLLISFDGPIRSAKAGIPADSDTATAPPAPHIADVLTACGESGRFAAVVTRTPVADIRTYLDAHNLSTQITVIASSIGEAASALDASPTDCVVIASTPSEIEAAQAADVPSIADPAGLFGGAPRRFRGSGVPVVHDLLCGRLAPRLAAEWCGHVDAAAALAGCSRAHCEDGAFVVS